MGEWTKDLRLTIRRLGRDPGFALVVVLTLALGIGANTAIFTVVDGVLLTPPPYQEPDELVLLWGIETGQRSGSNWASWPDYQDFEQQLSSFSSMAAYGTGGATLSGYGGEPIRVVVGFGTSDLLPTLGLTASLGRGFTAEEDALGGPPVAMLSHGFWQRRFGADSSVVGIDLVLDGAATTVVGVLPPEFRLVDGDVFRPLVPVFGGDARGQHRIVPLGRLAQGVTHERAEQEVVAVAARLEAEYPGSNSNRSARLESLREARVGSVRATLWTVFALVGVVLLIACVNVANLLLARANHRVSEIAVRTALGAERRHIFRQLGTESLVLAFLGGMGGLAVAFGGLRLLRALAPPGLVDVERLALSGSVLLFATLVTGGIAAAFGLIPLRQTSNLNLNERLKSGGRNGSDANRHGLLKGLVVGEIALATIAAVGAGLLVASFLNLQSVDAGFTRDAALIVPIALPPDRYFTAGDENEDGSRPVRFYEEVERRVAELPGVRSVASTYMHPLAGGWESSFWIPGVVENVDGQNPEARLRPVSPGYFETVGLPLLSGRDVDERDNLDAPGVVVVNESFVTTFFPDGDALGRVVARSSAWWARQPTEFEIIGVVADEKMDGLDASVPTALYFSHPQFPFADMNLVVAPEGQVDGLAEAIATVIREVDPGLPVEGVQSLAQIRTALVGPERFRTFLSGLFAGLAILLSAIGIYGVLAYSVSSRFRELGVRMSLGASRTDVVRLILGEGLRLTVLGLVLGLGVSSLVGSALSSMLFGVAPFDPATYALVGGSLGAVALIACLLPAVRATRVDPMVVLRTD